MDTFKCLVKFLNICILTKLDQPKRQKKNSDL